MAAVRVLWLNAHCLPLVTSRARARAVADYVLAIVRRDPVDAVAMCEVWGVARGVIARALESESEEWSVALAPWAAPRASSGLLLAWRRAVAGPPSSLAFGDCRLPDCLAAKGALGVQLRFKFGFGAVDSREVWLAATHLQDGQPAAACRRATLRQLGQLLGWARGQAGDRAAAVVVGDFNLEPDAVRREAAPRWRVAAPGVPTVPGEGAELDFALVRGGDVRVRCAVVDSPRSPSDHVAVLVTIAPSSQ